jgi:hypothetical protein
MLAISTSPSTVQRNDRSRRRSPNGAAWRDLWLNLACQRPL